MPNNKGGRTLFDLCGANNMTLTGVSGAVNPVAWWNTANPWTEFDSLGGVSPAQAGKTDADVADLDPTGFTCSCWIWPREVSTYNVVMGGIHTSYGHIFYLGWYGTGLIYNGNGGALTQAVGPNLTAYTPYFATWTANAGNGTATVRMYLNGFEVANSGGRAGPNELCPWYMGHSYYGYGANGGIGSFRVYNREMLAGECLALYREELDRCPTTLNRYRPRTIFLGAFTASPQTATPGVAALTTARYAPSIALPKLATPPVQSLSITRYAPTASTPRLATPGMQSLAMIGYAPTASTPRLAAPGVQSLATARYAPTASTPRLATPGMQSLAMIGYAPTASTPRLAAPGVQSLATARYAPTASTPRLATPGAQSLATASYAPSIVLPQTVAPSTQILSLTCYNLHVIYGITPGAASLSLTCYAPVVTGAGPLGGPVTSYASISPLVTSTVSLQLSIASQVESSLSIRT